MQHSRRLTLMASAAITGTVFAIAVGGAPAAPAHTTHRKGRLVVGVELLRLAASGRTLAGTGLVTATLTDNGRRATTRTRVALTASAGGGSCRVLHLFLNELSLSLLGLNAHLDKVQLDITGNARAGVLGSLFCRLARARVAAARAADARALAAAVRRRRGRVMHFTAYVSPQATASQAANASCQVLDLVVGPLNLQLLGLVVNLQRVHLTVTATRGQGVLGDLFCTLADNNRSGTSTGSTGTTSSTGTTTSGTTTSGTTT
jgi:hypothetical protein